MEHARKSLKFKSLGRILTNWSVFLIRGVSPRSVETAFRDKYKLFGKDMDANTELHLRQTAAWCLHAVDHDDLGTTTRTDAIRPDLFASCDHLARLDAIHKTTGTLHLAVQQICQRRAALVQKLRLKLPAIDYCKVSGRIFGTDFDTDSCQAATDVSNGFFDLSDIPGWDTWFAYEPHDHIQGRIYGWIPNEIAATVGRGIWAIPVESVWWIDAIPDTAK